MNFSIYSHCAGNERVPQVLQDEISTAIKSILIKATKGSGAVIRDDLMKKLISKGWSREVSVSRDSEMTITSIKSGVGFCFQTGNMARIYADLLKLQKLYMDNSIASAIIIIPSSPIAKIIGDNIAHATRLERELEIFCKVINIPLILYALE
jgi:hypothetical protein